MTIGLGTYAFFWQWHGTASEPLGLVDMINKTAGWDVDLFQVCDYPLIETYDAEALAALHRHAAERGVELELGTRGITPEHLTRYLRTAEALGVTLVRSMIGADELDQAARLLEQVVPAYQAAGVTLALETYEQIPSAELVRVVEEVGSPALGICLDPGNSVARLELPTATVELTAPHVRSIHVKDFTFSRRDGWVGFTFAGCPLGEGLLDHQHLVGTVRPDERGINQVVEHWLPWQGDSATTIQTEDQWTVHNLSYLRSRTP
ncbi:sugar phosphate isomerase/epimerase family protein [Auraticoccus monumenti]|uniref:Sugar phosphate isomerase/epimerase n=1 Tax=Auraticoccus monumenti TaxID=675864 RepID=A0A1G6YVK6_9ACTN|nr:TIM barrel protein [Auraticoccus monumenti]SDD94544.1 Sugar phosphate isomerase/epimerase [Auraticoccus monumenti]